MHKKEMAITLIQACSLLIKNEKVNAIEKREIKYFDFMA